MKIVDEYKNTYHVSNIIRKCYKVDALFKQYYNVYEQKLFELKRLFNFYEKKDEIENDYNIKEDLKNILKDSDRKNEMKVKLDDEILNLILGQQ